jgi:hypothetical protein
LRINFDEVQELQAAGEIFLTMETTSRRLAATNSSLGSKGLVGQPSLRAFSYSPSHEASPWPAGVWPFGSKKRCIFEKAGIYSIKAKWAEREKWIVSRLETNGYPVLVSLCVSQKIDWETLKKLVKK